MDNNKGFLKVILCFLILYTFNLSINNISNTSIKKKIVKNEEYFGYFPYGIGYDGLPLYENKEIIRRWVKGGLLTEREGELEIQFMEATTDEEKERIYKEIVDSLKDDLELSEEETVLLKDGGYKNYNKNLDVIYYQELVNQGVMSKAEMEIQIKYNSTKNKEERQKVYIQLVDNLIDENKITRSEAYKLKSDGYRKHLENMEEIQYMHKVDKMFDYGYISIEEANKLKNRTDDGRWKEVDKLYEKVLLDNSKPIEINN